MNTSKMFSVLALTLCVVVSACRSSDAPIDGIAGDYALVSVNSQSLPYTIASGFVLTSATIAIKSDGTYSAATQYNNGSGSRVEIGDYSVSARVVTLRARDRYTRQLSVAGTSLVQQNSGDTGALRLVYARQ